MEYIAHRINTVGELLKVPAGYGVEVDLRDRGDRLILQHDPFRDGEEFDEYLKHYRHGTLILNIKSERVEPRVKELLDRRGITNYFFLDSSFPMIYLLGSQGERNVALRFSEFEGLDTIVAMKGRAKWVWVDCFTKLPVNRENYKILKDAGYKICLVSPELQGREEDIISYRDWLSKESIVVDAVCTKLHNIPKWSLPSWR